MRDVKFIITIIAYGFTSLLLVIGFLIYSGSSIANIFIDASETMDIGYRLMVASVILYIMDTIIVVFMYMAKPSGYH